MTGAGMILVPVKLVRKTVLGGAAAGVAQGASVDQNAVLNENVSRAVGAGAAMADGVLEGMRQK